MLGQGLAQPTLDECSLWLCCTATLGRSIEATWETNHLADGGFVKKSKWKIDGQVNGACPLYTAPSEQCVEKMTEPLKTWRRTTL
jgi:hypothetical protein